jgi:hypothetical protein
MAKLKPEVEWIYNPNTYFVEYGLLGLAGKWAVVRAKDFNRGDYNVITAWVDERRTAIGFLKLLTEK